MKEKIGNTFESQSCNEMAMRLGDEKVNSDTYTLLSTLISKCIMSVTYAPPSTTCCG